MTVWLHGKLPLAELDEKAISVPSDSGGRLMSSTPPQIDDGSELRPSTS